MRVCALLTHTMDAAADAGPGEAGRRAASCPPQMAAGLEFADPPPPPLPPVEHLRLLLVQALSPTSREDAATYPE